MIGVATFAARHRASGGRSPGMKTFASQPLQVTIFSGLSLALININHSTIRHSHYKYRQSRETGQSKTPFAVSLRPQDVNAENRTREPRPCALAWRERSIRMGGAACFAGMNSLTSLPGHALLEALEMTNTFTMSQAGGAADGRMSIWHRHFCRTGIVGGNS